MTPATKDQADFQPWLYQAFKAPETVIVAVPYHKGDKQYWLVRTNRILSDDELNLRTIIHSQSSRALPDHIESVSKLAPFDPTEANGDGEAIGIIYVRIRRDALKNYYVAHDFPEGVDDGGDYRTYKLSSYTVDSFELGQDRISEFLKSHRKNQGGTEVPKPKKEDRPLSIVIPTKFVEIESGVEELDFDWTKSFLEQKRKKSEQYSTGQPATRPESKSEGSDKPQPEAEGRSR
jgi:hypothetical protein